MDQMAAIRQTFFEECEEQLADLESGLIAMNDGAHDSETVNAVFRAVHSIKGGAGAFKLDSLVAFAHVFETVLDHIRSARLAPDADVMRVMLRASDILADLVRMSRQEAVIDEAHWQPVAGELQSLVNSGAESGDAAGDAEIDFEVAPISFDAFGADAESNTPAQPAQGFAITFKATAALYAKANEPALLLRELSKLGAIAVTCNASELPGLDALDPAEAYLSWSIRLETSANEAAIREVFEFVDGDCELHIGALEGGDACAAAVPAEPGGDSANDAPDALPAGDIDAALQALLASVRGEEAPSAAPASASAPTSARAPGDPAPAAAAAEAPTVTPASPSAATQSTTTAAASPAAGAPSTAAAEPPKSTIRVDLDRVDRLINLVGELVINQAMLSQRVMAEGFANSSNVMIGLDELEQLTREIQESVMAIRAQPVKPLFQRMSRIIREVCEQTGKNVRLKTEGEATEVDKTVVERLADPLTHMIRNAVDHGIEGREARIAAGKPAEGTVRLSAAHRSGRIIIEVADDGSGIDRARVRQKAIERGLITPEAQLSEGEIDNLLFMPGFSTAQTVSAISGRGVGMDVVKRSIQALGGRISISSRPGRGSTFSLSLPLTLAVLDGMVVSAGGQTLVVPLTAIVETLMPNASSIHPLGGDARVMAIRGSFVPLIDVGRELGFCDEAQGGLERVAILVEGESGSRHALLVDAIQDQRQVVIKSLESNYGRIAGIAAATILGDGRVALILDVDAVVARSPIDTAIIDLDERRGALAS